MNEPAANWPERTEELAEGLILAAADGDTVKLIEPVPGDEQCWFAARWEGDGWSEKPRSVPIAMLRGDPLDGPPAEPEA